MELPEGSPLQIILILGNMFLALSVFLFLMYVVQIQSFQSRTKKYRFVSQNESNALRGTAILFACSLGFYAFILSGLSIGISSAFQYVLAGLLALSVGFAVGYILWTYLSYYHPFILEKRLTDIRFSPMKSPVTGKPMTLLNEDQEDVHLSTEMIEEENSLSVDYDVWIDEESDYKVIERYDTRFHSLICESCNFRTLTERKEEVIKEPQKHHKGILRKHYECTYCGHIESKDVDIPSWDKEREFDRFEKDVVELPTFNR